MSRIWTYFVVSRTVLNVSALNSDIERMALAKEQTRV